MQLLFLTSRLPYPPDRGDRLRTYQFLKLFAREHAVTLVSFISDEKERVLAEELATFCEEIHLVYLPPWKSASNAALNVWRSTPLQALYYHSRQMERVIDDLLSATSFDAAYVHLFRMASYLENQVQLYRIMDLTDLVSFELRSSLPYQTASWRTLYRFEEPRIARYERRAAAHYDEVWFISARDRDLFSMGEPQERLQVVPNIIDERLLLLDKTSADATKLLFVGHLDVRHNIDAAWYMAEEIMPLILHELPQCELQIVGAGSGQKVAGLDELPGVRVVGFVPDLRTVFADSAVSVAPLRFSAGIQNKVIESMAAGLPVVTSSSVSAGIGTKPGSDLLVADSAGDFAAQVLRLLRDKGLRQSLGRAGRAFVQTHMTAQAAAGRLRAINELVG